MARAKKYEEFSFLFLTPVRLSHFGARICIKRKKTILASASTVYIEDNQVMTAREESMRKKTEKYVSYTYKHIYHGSYQTFLLAYPILMLLPITVDCRHARWFQDDEKTERGHTRTYQFSHTG